MSDINPVGSAVHDGINGILEDTHNSSSFKENNCEDEEKVQNCQIRVEDIKKEIDYDGQKHESKNGSFNDDKGKHDLLNNYENLLCGTIKLEPLANESENLKSELTEFWSQKVKMENDEDSNASSTELYTWKNKNKGLDLDHQSQKNKEMDTENMVMYIFNENDGMNNVEFITNNTESGYQNRRKRKGTKPMKIKQNVEKSTENNVFTCFICDERFEKKNDLKMHAKTHVEHMEYICKVCGEQFMNKIEFKKHERTHAGPKRHKCELCGKVCKRKAELNGHMRTHSGEKPFICPTCGKGFGFAHHLKGHILTHTNEKPFICEVCGRGFNDKSSMRRHIRTHSNKSESKDSSILTKGEKIISRFGHYNRSLICEFCGKSFYKAQHLRVHVRTHTGEKPHQCETCGKQFNDPSSLRRHCRTYAGRPHSIGEERPKEYKCPICAKTLSYSRNFRYHVKRHTAEKTHECVTCGKKYHTKHHLQLHAKSHSADKPYKCTACDKRFGTYSMWYCHSKMHKGERKYQCDICSRFFLTGAHLKSHLASHKGEELNSCLECGKSFTHNSALKKHIKMHTSVPLFKCFVCERQFKEELDLYQHNFLMHGENSLNEDFVPAQNNVVPVKEESRSMESWDVTNKYPEEKNLVRTSGEKYFEKSNLFPSGLQEEDISNKKIYFNNLVSEMNSQDFKQYRCTACNKSFKYRSYLEEHFRIHTGLNLHECTLCGLKFTQKSNFHRHLEAHGDKLSFQNEEDREANTFSNKNVDFELDTSLDDAALSDADSQIPSDCTRYACSECDMTFKEKRYLTEHFRSHTRLVLHECEICGKKFTNNAIFQQHMETHSDEVNCQDGSSLQKMDISMFVTEENQSTSSGEVNKNTEEAKLYTCLECGKTFKEKRYLAQHFKIHTGQNLLECEICGKKVTKKTYFLQHLETHKVETGDMDSNFDGISASNTRETPKPYDCSECGRTFKEKRYLAEHFRIHTGEDLHECKICGKKFTKKSHYKRHIKIHPGKYPEDDPVNVNSEVDFDTSIEGQEGTNVIPKRYQCSECDRNFNDRGSLTTHFKIHTGIDLHECEICHKKFTKKPNFLRHVQSHTGEFKIRNEKGEYVENIDGDIDRAKNVGSIKQDYYGAKPFVCSECGKRFADKSSLTIHFRIHTGLNLHSCEICGKQFTKKSHYQRHVETHDDKIKPFPCTECHKRFSDKSSLSTHYRIHTGVNVRECDVCGKKFTKNYNFLRHTRTHTGDRPHLCTFCGKGFSENNSLARHVKSQHTGKTPFNCHLCHEGFYTEYSLKKHVITHDDTSDIEDTQIDSQRPHDIHEEMAPSELIQEILNEMMDDDDDTQEMNYGQKKLGKMKHAENMLELPRAERMQQSQDKEHVDAQRQKAFPSMSCRDTVNQEHGLVFEMKIEPEEIDA